MSSADLLYDFGGEPEVLGVAAVVHALSDIYAERARPAFATLVLGVPQTWLDTGAAAEVLKAAFSQLDIEKTKFAGGHTVRSPEPFVAISAVGEAQATTARNVPASLKRELLLSKGLGSGLCMSAIRQGLLRPEGESELSEYLRHSNRRAALAIGNAEREFESLADVRDVTGFGLFDAVRGISKEKRVTLFLNRIPVLTSAVTAAEAGVASALLDQNALRSDGFTHRVPAQWRAILNDPQTCGPLLVSCTLEMSEVLQRHGFLRIGTSVRDGDNPRIEVVE